MTPECAYRSLRAAAPLRTTRARVVALWLACWGCGFAGEAPADDGLRTILQHPSEVAFQTAISERIGGLPVDQIQLLRTRLAGLAEVPAGRQADALDMLDRYWADQAPKALLEAIVAGAARPGLDVQSQALGGLLALDVEAAIHFYPLVPAYGNFQKHCEFYERLSAIDPERAVKLYFESPDRLRVFNNPLETAFAAWAKRDFGKAWAGAQEIGDVDKRRSMLGLLVKTKPKQTDELLRSIKNADDREVVKSRLELLARVDAAPPPAPPLAEQHRKAKAEQAKQAAEDAAIEKLLQDGYLAYEQSKTDEAYQTYERMIRRYPERAWDWLSDMSDSNSYAWNRYRDLAQYWPKEKLPTTTSRMLDGKRRREITFGLELGVQWMMADPEVAVPFLFSRYPQHGERWLNGFPHHAIVHVRKWDEVKALEIVNKIEDPKWRRIAHQDVQIEFMKNLAPKQALESLLALEDVDAALRFRGFYRRHGTDKEDREFFRAVMALGEEHALLRDRLLVVRPKRILDAREGDVGLIPEILMAISDPQLRLEAIMSIVTHRAPELIASRLVEMLGELPPGADRDKCLRACIDTLSAADRLGLVGKTDNMALRAALILALPANGWSDDDFARCQDAVRSLPDEWTNKGLLDKWRLAVIGRANKQNWAKAIREIYEREGYSSAFVVKTTQWMKEDPKVFLEALEASGTLPFTTHSRVQALLLLHENDHAAIFRELRRHPLAPKLSLPALLAEWRQKDGRAALAATLLVADDELRFVLIDQGIMQWAQGGQIDAAQWVKSLPPGEERSVAAKRLAERWRYSRTSLPDWLEAEIAPEKRQLAARVNQQPGVEVLPQSEEAAFEEQQKRAEALANRHRTMDAVRALALVDEAVVVAQVGKLPEGAQKVDSLLGLLEYATAASKVELRQSVLGMLIEGRQAHAREIAEIVLNSLPLEKFDEAIAYERGLADADARDAAAEIIFNRWSGADYRKQLTEWIRATEDVDRRKKLAERHFRSLLISTISEPATMPDPESSLRAILSSHSRKNLILAILDGHKPGVQELEGAALPEPLKEQVIKLLEDRK